MRAVSAGLISLLVSVSAGAQGRAAYSLDIQQSKMEIHVSKEGAFKAFGHDHLIAAKQISGQVQFDPQKIEQSSVHLRIPTKQMALYGSGFTGRGNRCRSSDQGAQKSQGESMAIIRGPSKIAPG